MNEEFGAAVTAEGNILRINNAMVSDRGMYVCTARNEGGTAQAAAIIEVERKFLSLPKSDAFFPFSFHGDL